MDWFVAHPPWLLRTCTWPLRAGAALMAKSSAVTKGGWRKGSGDMKTGLSAASGGTRHLSLHTSLEVPAPAAQRSCVVLSPSSYSALLLLIHLIPRPVWRHLSLFGIWSHLHLLSLYSTSHPSLPTPDLLLTLVGSCRWRSLNFLNCAPLTGSFFFDPKIYLK